MQSRAGRWAFPRPFLAAAFILVVISGWSRSVQSQEERAFGKEREAMVQLLTRSPLGRTPITNKSVLEAMAKVPRHEFVPKNVTRRAYSDSPLPIGHGQTISQPYIVALMTESVALKASDVVLEVGTGSGYQAAVLAEMVQAVYTIEIVEALGREAAKRLERLGYGNVHVRIGDGYKGWKEHAPFDAIVVTAAPDHIPQPLIDQLKPGGRMVIPVGGVRDIQRLLLLEKAQDGKVRKRTVEYVRFVPFTGEAVKKGKG